MESVSDANTGGDDGVWKSRVVGGEDESESESGGEA